jgi:hypothetical protein
MQPRTGTPVNSDATGAALPTASQSKLKRTASNAGSSTRTAGTKKKRLTTPRASGIGQDALRICHFGTASDTISDVPAENNYLWVGKKACPLSKLQEHYPGLCWSSLMSHLKGHGRFGVCMQSDHPDHQDFNTKAHALDDIPFSEVRLHFQ